MSFISWFTKHRQLFWGKQQRLMSPGATCSSVPVWLLIFIIAGETLHKRWLYCYQWNSWITQILIHILMSSLCSFVPFLCNDLRCWCVDIWFMDLQANDRILFSFSLFFSFFFQIYFTLYPESTFQIFHMSYFSRTNIVTFISNGLWALNIYQYMYFTALNEYFVLMTWFYMNNTDVTSYHLNL